MIEAFQVLIEYADLRIPAFIQRGCICSTVSFCILLHKFCMHNLYHQADYANILHRINGLGPDTQPLWGKMNVAQMITHCQRNFEVFFGDKYVERGLFSYLFGRIARKKLFTDKPWKKNLPTAKEYLVRDQRDFDKEKARLVSLIHRFHQEKSTGSLKTHPFFGQMSAEDWAILQYKHLDHHLQQFGV